MGYQVAFISLGCDKNRVNCEQMAALVQDAGHIVLDDPEGADLCVVNTCGFIDAAKEEAIANILEMAQLKSEGKLGKILVTGCLSQRYREEIKAELPEVDGILGTGSYTDIVSAIDAVMAGGYPEYFGDINDTVEDGDRMISSAPWVAYLKIAEGCFNRCAFCIIPKLRGRYRSRSMESILAEAKVLSDSGVEELILIAQDVTRYGQERYKRQMLPQLLTELCKLDFHWIRLHYLYPEALTDEMLDVIAREDKIVKYFDIPIQHCNDAILKAMRRRGDKAHIENLFRKIREKMPQAVIRTSIICGLPGEGEAEFEELCQFLREQKLVRAGVFQFSPEEGTEAYTMPGQVDPETAQRRVQLLAQLQADIMDEWNESRLGQVEEVLVEGFDEEMGCWAGRSWADSPGVDGTVYFTAAGDVPLGTFVPVLLTGMEDGELMGEIDQWEEEA
ncbi:MAG: 30S ribosomal protein S12 methylthiotransferase RimO [Oscillospiraceae bacterium]|nr:30S ribosomal protein S12 methylthiotransferase RimO [Oscillospiraceae bacterium]